MINPNDLIDSYSLTFEVARLQIRSRIEIGRESETSKADFEILIFEKHCKVCPMSLISKPSSLKVSDWKPECTSTETGAV